MLGAIAGTALDPTAGKARFVVFLLLDLLYRLNLCVFEAY
jgi:hypothetical protein